jgi:serine/threonine protein kinase
MFREKIGEGSIGYVYTAIDMKTSETVAVKVSIYNQT